MKVLFVATEMAPFFKVGGLGDVIGSLPKALRESGVDVKVVLPLYPEIKDADFKLEPVGQPFDVSFNDQTEKIEIYKTNLEDLEVFFIANENYIGKYHKVAIAGNQKEVNHYAFFSKACVEWLVKSDQSFDIVHLHDWHVGLVPHIYKLRIDKERIKRPKFIFTIHNLGYHGFSQEELVEILDLANIEKSKDDPYFDFDAREDHELDLLLQGILSADFITTVSPSYAREIQTPEYCQGLCDVLKIRSNKLIGILNGLDYENWNPETDPSLAQNFHLDPNQDNALERVCMAKKDNKKSLQSELGLAVDGNICLLAFVGRLDPAQKGLDILHQALEQLIKESDKKFQFVLLGDGDLSWQHQFAELAKRHPRQISANLKFDDPLGRRIYASSDLMLIPSQYEPCGLVQMIAMRYGGVPIVRATGGLKDSVQHLFNGFVFEQYNSREFLQAIDFAMDKYYSEQMVWQEIVKNAITTDFSWHQSAQKYIQLYQKVIRD